jgi:hypothetical protein
MAAPATSAYKIVDHSYDVVVVGAGGFDRMEGGSPSAPSDREIASA